MDDDGPPGVPEWVVTYGDMMSLLLTFFIMLVSLSEVVADKKYRAIMEAIQQYVGYRLSPISPPGKNFPLNSFVEKLTTLGAFMETDQGRGGIRDHALPGEDVHVYHTYDGLSQKIGRNLYFVKEKKKLSTESASDLENLVEILEGKQNKIEIRTYVSSGKLSSFADAPDKLLLSYLRGRYLYDVFRKAGVHANRIRISPRGNYRSRFSKNGTGLNSGDRAEIFIFDKFTNHFQGEKPDR